MVSSFFPFFFFVFDRSFKILVLVIIVNGLLLSQTKGPAISMFCLLLVVMLALKLLILMAKIKLCIQF